MNTEDTKDDAVSAEPKVGQVCNLPSGHTGQVENLHHFQGFDEFSDVEVTRRRLPHWQQEGVTYFVTFRLADSIPADKLAYIEEERDRWLASHPEPWTEEQKREYYACFCVPIERWLDVGYGSCAIAQPQAAAMSLTLSNTLMVRDTNCARDQSVACARRSTLAA
jgi:hypothetical protein